jgi:hypothetical protein
VIHELAGSTIAEGAWQHSGYEQVDPTASTSEEYVMGRIEQVEEAALRAWSNLDPGSGLGERRCIRSRDDPHRDRDSLA